MQDGDPVAGTRRRVRPLWFIASAIGVLAFAAGIIVFGGLHAAMEYTNRLDFCISCHTMRDGPYAEYAKTPHYQNASGVRANCADCHVPRAWLPKVVAKIEATSDLYHEVIGTINTPEKFEAQRLVMAKRVWARMTANDSRECRNCHFYPAMDFHKQRPESVEAMEAAAKDGETCIACHKGVAHELPDMGQGIQLAFEDLQAKAAKEGARGSTLYAIATKSLFLEQPNGTPDGKGDARLLAASAVTVLERRGDWLNVRIEGWQQEGAERVIYAMRGQRILVAALGSDAIDRLEQLETVTDPETDLVWHRVALAAWTTKSDLIADRAPLWAYGAELYNDACGSCHAPHPTDHHLANQWIGTMNAMKQRVSLDDEQFRFLQKYLQLHASDTASPRG